MSMRITATMCLFLMCLFGCTKSEQTRADLQAVDDGGKGTAAAAQAHQPQGELKDGLKHGKWVFFHANGKRAAEGEYNLGNKAGPWIYWYDNGQKTAEGSYDQGLKTGKWVAWDEAGAQVSEKVFADGHEVVR